MGKGWAKAVVLRFFDAYLVRRDLEGTLSCLAEAVQWVGTGSQEFTCGIEGTEQILREELGADSLGYCFEIINLDEQDISERSAVVLLTARVTRGGVSETLRVTVVCVLAGGEARIVSVHGSIPDVLQKEGEFFPTMGACGDRGEFDRQVEVRTLDLLGKSIPGGIMGGYLEPGFPLYYINKQMLKYLGYTYEEFLEDTNGYVINCMHPDDREQVDKAVAEAFARDEEYMIKYRMRKCDGSYIWVFDIGKKGIAEDGREVCISVIRDISKEEENEHKLAYEAQQKEQQASRYDKLFESVLCGIVQYRLDENREVVFENANREAIRIFGYEPEEFWAKRDWNLPLLIVEEDRERILKEVGSLAKVGDTKNYEYRVQRKDGSSCWIIGSAEVILNGDGQEIIQSVFLDIDKRKKAEQRNRLLSDQVEASNVVLKLALEHTTTCEFYYYPARRLCVLPERLCDYYGTRPEYGNVPYDLADACVAPEYRAHFCESFGKISGGERTSSLEFKTNVGLWCRITLTVISYLEDGEPNLVIGILEDISRQKEMEFALEAARSRDMLTGLYNKETGVRMVQEYMRKKPAAECCCLMLLDMDDLGNINKTEGNAFADAILQEVAAILRAETSEEDIQIRLGGDEFMLFIKNCKKDQATIIGPRIAEQVRSIVAWPDKNLQVSVSIGMCVTDVANEYNSLYRCSESVLKYVKEHGKGNAACYLDTSNELGINLTQLYVEEHLVNTIDRVQPNGSEDLVSFALDLLGKSKKLDDAVFLLLARIGKTFHLDRVSILEADREYLTARFSYQWVRKRSDFKLGQEFYISAEELETAVHSYNEEGLCTKNINPRIFTAASGLHAGIWDCGELVGDMSFEVNEKDYQWPAQESRLLKELVKIVPSFCMKAKADAVSRAKTDFLSRMSHEIRTPMNAISGMTAIAKTVLDDKKRAMDCLEKIESANTYLLNLINDILDMSRIESGKVELNYENINIGELIKNLETLLKPQALEKGVALIFENEYQDGRLLMGDELRLNQVLINIIGNAVKFTDKGGTVTVKVNREWADRDSVRLHFSVEDTGIGIEPSALSRIFNVFEQADKGTAARHGGTGLGLAISSSLVQLMGGLLEVKSQVGKGSVFYFTLPFTFGKGEEKPAQAAEAEKKNFDFTGKRILLAEDNDLNQEIARTILEMQGILVECANDGAEAVALFEEHAPGYYDGILMDIRMPVMDGLEAARRIRTLGKEDSRRVPIIALSANAFDEDSRKSLESGMNGHLSKPIQVERLLEVLGSLIC